MLIYGLYSNIIPTDDIKSEKPLLSALKSFLLLSAVSCVTKKKVWTRKSADTLGFYFEGARLSGLTEKQVAIRACSLDTSGNSPYKQPIVLPGLPPGNSSKGSSRVASLSPCTIVPPLPSEVGGKRLSRCTILPYEGGIGSLAEGPRRSKVSFQSVVKGSKPVVINTRPTFSLGPYASKLALPLVPKRKKGKQVDGETPNYKGKVSYIELAIAFLLSLYIVDCNAGSRRRNTTKTTWKTAALQAA